MACGFFKKQEIAIDLGVQSNVEAKELAKTRAGLSWEGHA